MKNWKTVLINFKKNQKIGEIKNKKQKMWDKKTKQIWKKNLPQ